MINLKNDRELFVDDYIIDTDKTTAEKRLHHPVRRQVVLHHDAPWEGNGTDYHNFFYDNGVWRMYYLGWWYGYGKSCGIQLCYAESRDGIVWEKPSLGICEFEGSKDNNILLDKKMLGRSLDNFMVFRDDNPACPSDKKYKAVSSMKVPKNTCLNDEGEKEDVRALGYYVSPDGLHWEFGGIITTQGAFDSLNVAFYDTRAKKYRLYYRAAHSIGDTEIISRFNENHIRDIRYIESEDFENWTEPKLLDFGEGEDLPLYTNVVQNYYRAPHILVGFPSRYIYRRSWNKSFDELCGREARLERMKDNQRYGLTITDCVFMASRNGWQFARPDEAFIRPEPEEPYGWVYGTAYPARGMIETPSDMEGADPELSLYVYENHWSEKPADFVRYTIRIDGFISMHAGGCEKTLVTKPFTFEGSELFINFATSARGYIYIELKTEDGELFKSCETFGNSINRRVHFDKDIASLAGKKVVMTARMFDADFYSFCFGE